MTGDVLNINKPKGMTSHDVVDIVRRKTGERRVGHAGTLDPLATGVLVILVGRSATKRQAEFMGQSKEYEAELTFGSVSETYDAEGPITKSAEPGKLKLLTSDSVKKVLPQFIGEIKQQPPMHSAIKVDGRPLYKKARQGKITQAEVPYRMVTIDDVELLSFESGTKKSPPKAKIRIKCQKGVYIRSLANDIGAALGTGAFMSELVRTKSGDFSVKDALEIDDI